MCLMHEAGCEGVVCVCVCVCCWEEGCIVMVVAAQCISMHRGRATHTLVCECTPMCCAAHKHTQRRRCRHALQLHRVQ